MWVGLIAITTVKLGVIAIPNPAAAAIFAGALVVIYNWKHKLSIPAMVAAAGLVGWLCFRLRMP